MTTNYKEYVNKSLTDPQEAIAYIEAVRSDGLSAEIALCLANCQTAHPEIAGLGWQAAIELLARKNHPCWGTECCCHCQHQVSVNCHPGNQQIGRGSMSIGFGWACLGFRDEEANVAVFSD